MPDFMGGKNTARLEDNPGPWNDYEIVDGHTKDDIVGIRKISDGPNGKIFTPLDFEALPNPLLDDPQASVVHFNKHKRHLLDELHQKQRSAQGHAGGMGRSQGAEAHAQDEGQIIEKNGFVEDRDELDSPRHEIEEAAEKSDMNY